MPDSSKVGLGIADIIADKREDILRLAAQYGVCNVRIFGSVARGEAGETSDVDFLVEFPPDYTLLDHAGLVVSLRDLLGRRVEITNAAYLRDELRASILKDALPL